MSLLLHHGTFQDRLDAILDEGIEAPSYWGTADEASGYGDGPVFAVDEDVFDPDLLMPNTLLIESLREQDPDDEGVRRWDASSCTWRDSLEIFGSVRYEGRLSVESAMLRPFSGPSAA